MVKKTWNFIAAVT